MPTRSSSTRSGLAALSQARAGPRASAGAYPSPSAIASHARFKPSAVTCHHQQRPPRDPSPRTICGRWLCRPPPMAPPRPPASSSRSWWRAQATRSCSSSCITLSMRASAGCSTTFSTPAATWCPSAPPHPLTSLRAAASQAWPCTTGPRRASSSSGSARRCWPSSRNLRVDPTRRRGSSCNGHRSRPPRRARHRSLALALVLLLNRT